MSKNVPIGGINIEFPCEPYKSQRQLMIKIIESLKNENNCLLESPTGSGKTLALLCSTLAWQKHEKESNTEKLIPKIYFATRTQKQIKSVVNELKQTTYGKNIKMAILASRDHTCLNEHVMKSKNKTDECKMIRKKNSYSDKFSDNLVIDKELSGSGEINSNEDNTCKKKSIDQGCKFYNSLFEDKPNLDSKRRTKIDATKIIHFDEPVWDIEDLIKKCKEKTSCPYFVSRDYATEADIIFCPYNYLINPFIRSKMNIILNGNVVILDEAHNIEDVCRETAGWVINLLQIDSAINKIQEVLQTAFNLNIEDIETKALEYFNLKLRNLQNWITRSMPNKGSKNYNCSEIILEFEKIGIGLKDFCELRANAEIIENCITLKDIICDDITSIVSKLQKVLKYVYDENNQDDFVITVEKSIEYYKNEEIGKYTLKFICLNPAIAFNYFNSCHSIILCSGTLSPLDTFETELGCKFEHKVIASHVIKDKQVCVRSIGHGSNNVSLEATLNNRETENFQNELGNLILDICKIIPYGILCFLPSYKFLEMLMKYFNEINLLNSIKEYKQIFIEDKNVEKFNNLLKSYYEKINSSKKDMKQNGALLFAIYRGRASEGLNFSDNYARAVIAVGIPLPSLKDDIIKFKRQYNDKFCETKKLLNGNEWYFIQAFRALNQALGRCIRHINDWGAIILVDKRFISEPVKYNKGLSNWIKEKNTKLNFNYNETINSLKEFVESMIIEDENSEIINIPIKFEPDDENEENNSYFSAQEDDYEDLDILNEQEKILSSKESLWSSPKTPFKRMNSLTFQTPAKKNIFKNVETHKNV